MAWLKRLLEKLGLRKKPTPPPAPVPDPEPIPEPLPDTDPVNKDREGWGTFKPSTDLYMPPNINPTNGQRVLPSHIGTAGIYADRAGTVLVKWLRWPDGIGTASNQPINGTVRPIDDRLDGHWHPNYASGRIKLRSVTPDTGQFIIIRDIYRQELFWMRIMDGKVRQEGRTK